MMDMYHLRTKKIKRKQNNLKRPINRRRNYRLKYKMAKNLTKFQCSKSTIKNINKPNRPIPKLYDVYINLINLNYATIT